MKQHDLFNDLVFQYRFKQWCVTATIYVGLWNCIFSSCSTVGQTEVFTGFLSFTTVLKIILLNNVIIVNGSWMVIEPRIQTIVILAICYRKLSICTHVSVSKGTIILGLPFYCLKLIKNASYLFINPLEYSEMCCSSASGTLSAVDGKHDLQRFCPEGIRQFPARGPPLSEEWRSTREKMNETVAWWENESHGMFFPRYNWQT